jgi:drug/metabolite transporter (DMT)-like permease
MESWEEMIRVGVGAEKNIKNVTTQIKMKSDNFKALISVILAAIFGGGISVFAKIGLKQIPPFSFTFFRFFIASLCMLPFVLKEKQKIDKNLLKVVFLSLLATANVTLFAFGVRLTTATVSQMLYAVVPVIAAVFSYFLLKEKLNSRKIVGIFLGLVGVLTLIILPILGKSTGFSGNFLGNLVVLTAVTCFTIYTVLSKKFHKYYSPLTLTFIFSLTTAIVLSPLFLKDYLNNPIWIYHLNLSSIFSIFYVGIFGGAGYYLLYQYAIKHGSPIIASMTMYLQPTATFFWAFFLLSERLTIGIIIGGILAIGGALMVTRKT